MTWHVEALEVISTTRHQVWRPWAFFPHPVKATTTCWGGWKVEGHIAGGFFGGVHPLFDLEIVYVMEIGKGFQTHCRNGNEDCVYILKPEIWSRRALGWRVLSCHPDKAGSQPHKPRKDNRCMVASEICRGFFNAPICRLYLPSPSTHGLPLFWGKCFLWEWKLSCELHIVRLRLNAESSNPNPVGYTREEFLQSVPSCCSMRLFGTVHDGTWKLKDSSLLTDTWVL